MLFDRFNLPEDVYELLFSTEQQAIVARLLIDHIKANSGEIGKTEMSLFATKLQEGKIIASIPSPKYQGKKIKLSYNKRQFYDRILTPCRSMGIISYDMYRKKYKLSDDFNKEMIRIGLKWTKELRAPPKTDIEIHE